MVLTQEILERNELLIKSHLYVQMKAALDVGGEILDEELNQANILMKPIVHQLYNSMIKYQLELSTKKTINGTLKMSREMIRDKVGEGSPEFFRRIDRKFPAYLKNDQTSRQCKKNHLNYPLLARNLKKTFEWQIRPVLNLLKVEKRQISTYRDLCRAAYLKDELKLTLKNQTDAMSYGIKVIEDDKSILNMHIGKDLMIKVLRRGFDKKIDDFQQEIDLFYSN